MLLQIYCIQKKLPKPRSPPLSRPQGFRPTTGWCTRTYASHNPRRHASWNVRLSYHRILGMFSTEEENQIRICLADTVRWIVCQRLLPKVGGGRVAALEILFCPTVYERARHSCEVCGRLAMDEGLVCLPHGREQ